MASYKPYRTRATINPERLERARMADRARAERLAVKAGEFRAGTEVRYADGVAVVSYWVDVFGAAREEFTTAETMCGRVLALIAGGMAARQD